MSRRPKPNGSQDNVSPDEHFRDQSEDENRKSEARSTAAHAAADVDRAKKAREDEAMAERAAALRKERAARDMFGDKPGDSYSHENFEIDEQPRANSFSSAEDLSDDDFNLSNEQADEGIDTAFNPADYIADYIPDTENEFLYEDENATSQDNKRPEDYDILSRNQRRRQQRSRSKKRCLERARLALQGDLVAAHTWKPRPVKSIVPMVGMRLSARWKNEQLIRAQTADLGCKRH